MDDPDVEDEWIRWSKFSREAIQWAEVLSGLLLPFRLRDRFLYLDNYRKTDSQCQLRERLTTISVTMKNLHYR